ncbi:hypothetical protein GNI_101610 [Gregarina niphandrodes]|uniref:Uncharacterized protein n=1 Tax=Gregarina niphandrodes TaxID=110365 RepID=A0A023B4E5_GRENI|nr:hypothetical protein GNI_101610 [Gregarina niphandrodes]EZG56702.1 hypothetical protein GNI_101610 [Gregarina niphandrodes]|eukprot:XP_011131170.1 hypothetical protein GNI_101610 [Gregarina niphandrodes]
MIDQSAAAQMADSKAPAASNAAATRIRNLFAKPTLATHAKPEEETAGNRRVWRADNPFNRVLSWCGCVTLDEA